MPSPDTTYTDMPRNRQDPSSVPLEELIARLGTDPAKGLSPKEAESRRAKSTAGSLFVKPPRRFTDCLKQIAREPAFWMLLAVAVIALFFDRILLGAVCALLTVGNALLCAAMLRRTDRTEAAMAAYDAPLCRVLRSRRILRLSADALVAGDVILLYPGDIVPADCRLLRADGLTVLERELDASDPARPPLRLKKQAVDTRSGGDGSRVSPVNMVYAGGIVEEGSALAVAVAVGSRTHLGGLTGGLPSVHRGRIPSEFQKAARALSAFNLGLFCLLVPLTAIGIFTLGDRYEFLDIFLSSAALATVALTEHLVAKGCYLASATRRAAARDRDRESTADIRSSAVCRELTAMTDLLLVGSAALHDGLGHPETLRMGHTVYRCDHPEADDEARAVAEYLYVYRMAAASLPAVGEAGNRFLRLIPALCDWAEIDTDGLPARVEDIHPEGNGVTGIWRASEGNRRVRVLLTERFHDADSCDTLYDPSRRDAQDRFNRNSLYRVYREAVRQGSRMAFLILEEEGVRTLRAAVTYAPRSDRRVPGCIKGLERSGIRVTAFLRDASDRNLHALSVCGLTESAPADRPGEEELRTAAAERIRQGVRAFAGCEEDYILQCIRDLKAEGRTVGVLSADGEDLCLLAEADIAFTCMPSLYASAEAGRARLSAEELTERDSDPDGLPDSRIATDRARRSAHVLVRRSSAGGGGVLGVRNALLTADACGDVLARSLRLLLLTQTVRILMTVIPLCLGLAVAAAPVLLMSGLGLDLLFMLTYLHLPKRDIPAPRCTGEPTLRGLWLTHRVELISSSVGAVLPWIVVGIAALAGASFGGDLLYFGLLCTVGLQAVQFRADTLPKRDRGVFLATLAAGLVYVGSLAASLAAGLGLIWAMPLPLIAPAAYLLTRAILTRALKGTSSKAASRKA